MSIRCWLVQLASVLLATTLLVVPVDAQVDPGTGPSSLEVTDPEAIGALRLLLSDAGFQAEVASCFAAGPLRQIGFRRFYQDLYIAKLVFGDAANALQLNVFVRALSSTPTITSYVTAVPGGTPLSAAATDFESFQYLAWLFQNYPRTLLEFAPDGTLVVAIQRLQQRQGDSFICSFEALEASTTLQLAAPGRLLTACSLYSPSIGFFDTEFE